MKNPLYGSVTGKPLMVVRFCLTVSSGRIHLLPFARFTRVSRIRTPRSDHKSHRLTSYAHTMVKPPDPIRTPKLSTIGPAQYCGGGPRGNRRWCTFLFHHRQKCDNLAEWLRRWPAKPLCYAREGSNPSVVAILQSITCKKYLFYKISVWM